MRKESLLAHILVIPKKDKDITQCSSYSLLNEDIKLYAKVLANRLKGLMSEWIPTDQAGFVPGREGRVNGLKAMLHLQKIYKMDPQDYSCQ